MLENFFNFDIPLWVWIISQVIGAVGVGVAMWSFQVKNKIKLFIIIACSNVILAISSALLTNWVVVALLCIAAARGFIFACLAKREQQDKTTPKSIPLILMISFIVINIIAVCLTWVWWYDWLLLAASCLIIFGSWLKTTHVFRLSCLTYDSLAVINYIKFSNLIGLIQSALLVGSVLIFYVRFFISKKSSKSISV